MCILNRIQIWPRDAILHIFKENPRELPVYVCIRSVQQKSMCEQVIRDAHDGRFTKIKLRESYVLYAKTGQSSLRNQNIRFS
jgi:hypothetical protein